MVNKQDLEWLRTSVFLCKLFAFTNTVLFIITFSPVNLIIAIMMICYVMYMEQSL